MTQPTIEEPLGRGPGNPAEAPGTDTSLPPSLPPQLSPRAISWARRRQAGARAWHEFRRNGFGMAGLVILVLFVAMAVLAPLLVPESQLDVTKATGTPFSPPSAEFPLGTDESGRSVLRFGVRGVLSFELRARGADRDLHSGHWGDVAPNPLWTLVQLLATMKNARGEVTIEGFYDRVEPMTRLEQEAIERQLQIVESQLAFAKRATQWEQDTVVSRRMAFNHYFGPNAKKPL